MLHDVTDVWLADIILLNSKLLCALRRIEDNVRTIPTKPCEKVPSMVRQTTGVIQNAKSWAADIQVKLCVSPSRPLLDHHDTSIS